MRSHEETEGSGDEPGRSHEETGGSRDEPGKSRDDLGRSHEESNGPVMAWGSAVPPVGHQLRHAHHLQPFGEPRLRLNVNTHLQTLPEVDVLVGSINSDASR